ncbi:MAG: DUF192 domain-containing protein [Sphingomonadales bacterium]|nr:DUF192 domain-containing protein [Sphingomonadales bacterium]
MIRRFNQALLPLTVLALALPACSSHAADSSKPAASAPATHPVSGLPVVDLTVTHDGKPHAFRVEVARTGPEQERGLMFRTAMGADEGMIFPMNPRPASFWMKNTVIPLDIIFVGTNGRVLNIAANAIPYDETPLNSNGPVKGVLELNGGRAKALGITSGDTVKW